MGVLNGVMNGDDSENDNENIYIKYILSTSES